MQALATWTICRSDSVERDQFVTCGRRQGMKEESRWKMLILCRELMSVVVNGAKRRVDEQVS